MRSPKGAATDADGCMFPGEVFRRLRLERITYPQLRTLLRIARGDSASQGASWCRFSFTDLVAIKAAIKLGRDKNNPYGGRRLMLAEVELACRLLRERYGIASPLTTVRLVWEGRRIVAQFQGVHFEPASAQLLLTPKAISAVVRRMPRRDRAACKEVMKKAASSPRARVACGVQHVHGVLPLRSES